MALREIELSSYTIRVRSDDTSSMDANEIASENRTHRQLVLTGPHIIERLHLKRCLLAVSAKSRLGHRCFEHWCVPIAHRVAEYVQLFPLPGSARFGHAGGLLTWLLNSCRHALHLRLGDLLPRGTPTEEMFRNEHRWTLALFLAALVYDVDRILSEIRVEVVTREGGCRIWMPREGSLIDLQVTGYQVIAKMSASGATDAAFASTPDIYAKIAPEELSRWFSEDRLLSAELLAIQGLSTADSVLTDLVEHARREHYLSRPQKHVHDGPIKAQLPHSSDVDLDTMSTREFSRHFDDSAGVRRESGLAVADPPTNHPAASHAARNLLVSSESHSDPPIIDGDLSLGLEQRNPVVRKILALQNGVMTADTPPDLGHALGRFISFERIASAGIDSAYAVRCLADANHLLPTGQDGHSWVHCRHIDGREVRGILIRNLECDIHSR